MTTNSLSLDVRHFLELKDFSSQILADILYVAHAVKKAQKGRQFPLCESKPLLCRQLGVLLMQSSTRTRVSFEVGIRQLGGDSVSLPAANMQLGRGESIKDTARVLSGFLDAIVIRTGKTEELYEFAKWSSIPVINGLTPRSHPVQIMADILTYEEKRGDVSGKIFAWCGDGNNVLTSFIEAAVKFGFKLRIATPDGYKPSKEAMVWAKAQGGDVRWTTSVEEAVRGADCVVTDTWLSLADPPQEKEARLEAFKDYQVNKDVMKLAAPDALFMHCLPAYLGKEVSEDVFEGPQSVVFPEAENRLHAQKAILLWSMLTQQEWIDFVKKIKETS